MIENTSWISIFFAFGFGPPLGPWGAAALGMPELPGDQKKKKNREALSLPDIDIDTDTGLPKACKKEDEEE